MRDGIHTLLSGRMNNSPLTKSQHSQNNSSTTPRSKVYISLPVTPFILPLHSLKHTHTHTNRQTNISKMCKSIQTVSSCSHPSYWVDRCNHARRFNIQPTTCPYYHRDTVRKNNVCGGCKENEKKSKR